MYKRFRENIGLIESLQNVLASYVTLFQILVSVDWTIIMEGYSILYTSWCKIYFIVFYLVTMVVITIVVAFVLEAFLFRIQYKNKLGNIEQDTKVIVDVSLNQNEYEYCKLTDRLCDQTDQDRWKNM